MKRLEQIDNEIEDKAIRLRSAAIAAVEKLDPLPEWTRVHVRKSKRHRNGNNLLVQAVNGSIRVFEYSADSAISAFLSVGKEILPGGTRKLINRQSPYGKETDITADDLYRAYKQNEQNILDVISEV